MRRALSAIATVCPIVHPIIQSACIENCFSEHDKLDFLKDYKVSVKKDLIIEDTSLSLHNLTGVMNCPELGTLTLVYYVDDSCQHTDRLSHWIDLSIVFSCITSQI